MNAGAVGVGSVPPAAPWRVAVAPWWVAAALVVLPTLWLTLSPSVVGAQDLPREVTERVAQGEALFEADNYEAALVEFQAAYDLLEGNPERHLLLFNIGQCYERTFRYDRALAFYRRFQTEGGAEAEADAEVNATIRALEGLLATVVIDTNVPAATVWVDGLEVATIAAHAEVRVAGGLHRVEVRADGHASEQREIQAPARQRIEATFTLREVSDYEGVDTAAFWTVSAAAVALAAVGAGLWGYSFASLSDVMHADLSLRDDVATYALAGDVVMGAAAATAITAVVLAFVTDWDGSEAAPPEVALTPWLSPALVGASIDGAF